MTNFDWTDLLQTTQGEIYLDIPYTDLPLQTTQRWDLFKHRFIHILDMMNFDWTDLLHITQIWDLFRYRAIPYTGYDEFWVDRPVPCHPEVRYI